MTHVELGHMFTAKSSIMSGLECVRKLAIGLDIMRVNPRRNPPVLIDAGCDMASLVQCLESFTSLQTLEIVYTERDFAPLKTGTSARAGQMQIVPLDELGSRRWGESPDVHWRLTPASIVTHFNTTSRRQINWLRVKLGGEEIPDIRLVCTHRGGELAAQDTDPAFTTNCPWYLDNKGYIYTLRSHVENLTDTGGS